MQSLIDIIVSDNPKDKQRFIVRYALLSEKFNYRLYLVTKTKELMPLLSVQYIFNSSN
jgi:NADH:ubiquinone oxidoreductase subunit C